MRRRGLVAGLVATPWLSAAAAPPSTDALPVEPPPSDWTRFCDRFVTAEGRVRDTGNGDVSHSEGQGYGMLLAEASGDRAAFARLWVWTQRNLAAREDGLFAWKWDPHGVPTPVADRNNATDGDLLIAWALMRAARTWQVGSYATAARAILGAIRSHAVTTSDRGPLLLPGVEGFRHEDLATVNLSYWVFPALLEIGELDRHPIWTALARSGVELLNEARFGRFDLPPDWLLLSSPARPSPRFPEIFGYNAVRVPLHLRWAGLGDTALLEPFARFWRAYPPPRPATIGLVDDRPGADRASVGIDAIADLTLWQPGTPLPDLPSIDAARDYYAAALLLLTKLALREMPAT